MSNNAQQIVVGSQNPVKLRAAEMGFQVMFPEQVFTVSGLSVPSGVPAQPMTRAETLLGAQNRATNVAQAAPDADFTVGLEGGIEIIGDRAEVFAWAVVRAGEQIGTGQTGVFYLPQEVTRLIVDEGLELGVADDRIFQRSNSKHNSGSIGLLTNDAITRTTYYIPAVIMALIPFKNPHLTWT